MKKILCSLLTLALCLSLCLPMTSYAVSGKGTEVNPFRITNEEELLLLADFPECYFELENDIMFTMNWALVAEFSGNLNGKEHTITLSDEFYGFFNKLTGTVQNLVICADNLQMTSYSSFAKGTGILARSCSGIIKDCKVVGDLNLASSQSFPEGCKRGVFCGVLEENGIIENCVVQLDSLSLSGAKSSPLYFGGVCATSYGIIRNCSNITNETLITPYNPGYNTVGTVYYSGITYSNVGSINNCLNLSVITDTGFNGGVVHSGISYDNTEGNINCCYTSNNMLLNIPYYSKYGISQNGTVTNSYFDKTLLGECSNGTYGKSTLAMKMEATYAGWDFENVWAIDESEENPINDGYPYLRVFYEDVEETPVTISSVSVVNDKLVIDTKITDISDDYTLHVALYDDQNRLCDYLVIPNERQLKDVFVVFPDNGEAVYAKIFTWYSTNIQPVSICEKVIIER